MLLFCLTYPALCHLLTVNNHEPRKSAHSIVFFNEGLSLVVVVIKPHCTSSSLYFVKKSIFSAYDFLYLHRQLS